MTDEKKEAEPDWMRLAKLDDALRRKVYRLERDRLRNDIVQHADWLRENTPAARREWQRHCLAANILNGLLAGGAGTLEERLRLVDKADWNLLTAIPYKLAERMMERREQIKAEEEAKKMVRTHGEIAVDLFREYPKEPGK